MPGGSATIPQASYPSGQTIAGQKTFKATVLTTGSLQVDGSQYSDPACEVEAVIQFQIAGVWQDVVKATQFGSPTGWATKTGTTLTAFNFSVDYPGGVTVTGARLIFNVTNGPVTLGPVTLAWS